MKNYIKTFERMEIRIKIIDYVINKAPEAESGTSIQPVKRFSRFH